MTGLSLFRCALITRLNEQSEEKRYTLSAWFTILQDGVDRWVQIHPASKKENYHSGLETCQYWRDYLGPILKPFESRNKHAHPKNLSGPEWGSVKLD
jgi:hypothetical protein